MYRRKRARVRDIWYTDLRRGGGGVPSSIANNQRRLPIVNTPPAANNNPDWFQNPYLDEVLGDNDDTLPEWPELASGRISNGLADDLVFSPNHLRDVLMEMDSLYTSGLPSVSAGIRYVYTNGANVTGYYQNNDPHAGTQFMKWKLGKEISFPFIRLLFNSNYANPRPQVGGEYRIQLFDWNGDLVERRVIRINQDIEPGVNAYYTDIDMTYVQKTIAEIHVRAVTDYFGLAEIELYGDDLQYGYPPDIPSPVPPANFDSIQSIISHSVSSTSTIDPTDYPTISPNALIVNAWEYGRDYRADGFSAIDDFIAAATNSNASFDGSMVTQVAGSNSVLLELSQETTIYNISMYHLTTQSSPPNDFYGYVGDMQFYDENKVQLELSPIFACKWTTPTTLSPPELHRVTRHDVSNSSGNPLGHGVKYIIFLGKTNGQNKYLSQISVNS